MWLDPLLVPPVQAIGRAGLHAPVAARLSFVRRRAAIRVQQRHAPEAHRLARASAAGDPAARQALIELGEAALDALHQETLRALRQRPAAAALLRADARFHRCETLEHMDDPETPWERRAQLVERLHQMNRVLGTYESFWRTLRPLLGPGGAPTPAAPVRILELAAGTGGLARWMARRARDAGIAVAITASDVNEQALAAGARQAEAGGLPVRFAPANALDLTSLDGDWDVILCAQALHHFPAGWLPVMYHQAVTRARRGVLFVDGCRSLLNAAGFIGLGFLRYRDPGFSHDAWVSFRRFFVPAELGLLCALGPWARLEDARWSPPGHCVMLTDTRR